MVVAGGMVGYRDEALMCIEINFRDGAERER